MSLTVHINSLPDLVLRRIFSKVPLTDLLHTASVCPLWKYYQVETGKQVRSLTLLIGPNDTHQLITNSCFTFKYRDLLLNDNGSRKYSSQRLHKNFHLTFGSFTFNASAQLSNIFPHITTLEIAIKFFRGLYLLNPIRSLLSQWSPTLKSLKMYLKFTENLNDVQENWYGNEINKFVYLVEVINSMNSLEHLTLDSDSHIFPLLHDPKYFSTFFSPNPPDHLPNPIDLTILCRIREFYCRSRDHVKVIENFLQSYAVPNENLRKIGLDYSTIENIYKRFPQIANKIVYLPLFHSASNSSELRNISQLFGSITKLNLVNSQSWSGICDKLSKDSLNSILSLQQLEHLHVDNYIYGFFAPTYISLENFPQFELVRVLTIATEFESTSDFESNHWAHLFPNVQVIELIITVITMDDFNFTTKKLKRRSFYLSKQQLQQSLSPFVQCPKLHHIFTCEKYKTHLLANAEHSPPEMSKVWILLQVRNRKIIIQVEK